MNKEIYKAAFAIIKAQNEVCNNFERIGMGIDYSAGSVGRALENILNQSYMIIDGAIDFNRKTYTRTININGYTQPITFDVLYVGSYDENWTISEDDFSDFVYQAADNERLQDLFWSAMVERNEAAKEQFNKTADDCLIGRFWKD